MYYLHWYFWYFMNFASMNVNEAQLPAEQSICFIYYINYKHTGILNYI